MSWIILGTTKVNNRNHYMLKCACGYIGTRRKDFVDQGKSKECKSCSAKRTASKYGTPIPFSGCGKLSKTFYSTIKNGAKRRNIDFNVSIEYLWELFVAQQEKCALTGQEIILSTSIKNTNPNWDVITASVDRIDSTKGYEAGNIQWVHKEVNRLKNNYSMADFIKMCKLVAAHHANPEPSVSKLNHVDTKVQRLESAESSQ